MLKEVVIEHFCAVVPKISGSEKLYGYKSGCQDFPSKLLSHNAEKFGKRTLLCCLSENFRYRKSLCIGGGGYQDFPSKNFCLTMPKTLAREPFCVVFQKNSGSE